MSPLEETLLAIHQKEKQSTDQKHWTQIPTVKARSKAYNEQIKRARILGILSYYYKYHRKEYQKRF